MNGKRWIIFGIIVLVVLVGLVGTQLMLLKAAREYTRDALAPLQDANTLLKTQVANILNPTPTIIPDPVTIIHEIRSIARLETIQYSVEKIITAETGQGAFAFLLGDRLLFVGHGTVIAGVDLTKLTSEDLRLQNATLFVKLPEPQIFISALDNDLSYVYDRETGIFTNGNIDLETSARQAAEQEIEKAALEDGILLQARVNAEVYLSRLFDQLGYSEVIYE